MADLGKENAQWERLLEREVALMMLAPLRYLREVESRLRETRTQVQVIGNVDANIDTAGVTLAGADPGVNCTAKGIFYVRITGAGPYTVTLYKATGGGGGDAVAAGTGAADSLVTLSASNSSGVTGTWDLPASVTTTITDTLQLRAFVDFPALLSTVFDESIDDDVDSRRILLDAYRQAADQVRRARQLILNGAALALLGDSRNLEGRGNAFASSNERTLAADSADTSDQSGNVYRIRSGLISVLDQAMADETTGSTQYVLRRVVSAAAAVAGSNNQGLGAIASHTPQEKCPAGVLTLSCVDGTIGQERFDGYFRIAGTEQNIDVFGIQVGKAWSGPNGLGEFTLTRTLSKTGDGSNDDLAAATAFTVSGESSANTNDGDLTAKLVTNGSGWNVEFYRSSSLAATALVARAVGYATGAAFVASPTNGSGLTVNGTVGASPTNGNTATISINPFRVQNSSGFQDKFTITITVTEAGLIQTLLAEEVPSGAELNSTSSGSETIDDDYARSMTFADYAVEDN